MFKIGPKTEKLFHFSPQLRLIVELDFCILNGNPTRSKRYNTHTLHPFRQFYYFSTMKQLFILLFSICFSITFAQKHEPFQGTLHYRIDFQAHPDSTAVPYSKMSVYTNDTLVRVDSETTQLGEQVLITHLALQKYYLLIEFDSKKYAIQGHEVENKKPSSYTFKKKWGKKKIGGITAKKVLVSAPFFPKPILMWYAPNISPKYLSILKGIPGLPLDYYIQMEDGYLHYRLESADVSPVHKDSFGIGSDYKKVTFDQFIEATVGESE